MGKPVAGSQGFAIQSTHSVAPVVSEYIPAGHVVHDVAPTPEYVPAGHAVHANAPSLSEYVPAGHDSHVSVSAFKYCPAGHTVSVGIKQKSPDVSSAQLGTSPTLTLPVPHVSSYGTAKNPSGHVSPSSFVGVTLPIEDSHISGCTHTSAPFVIGIIAGPEPEKKLILNGDVIVQLAIPPPGLSL